jgi:hypothetical protein
MATKAAAARAFDDAFHRAWANVDTSKIDAYVDEHGIEAFIERCARKCAGSGAAANVGGLAVSAGLFVPDAVYMFVQQVKITHAVVYHLRGEKHLELRELFRVMAKGMGVRMVGNRTAESVAELAAKLTARLMARSGARLSFAQMAKLVPIAGGIVGGGMNYLLVRKFGQEMLAHSARYLAGAV